MGGIHSMLSTGRLLSICATVLILSLAACGGKQTSEEVPTLRRGISAKVGSLDPHTSSAQWENIVIGDMFIGLMTHGADGKPELGMAVSHEVSDNGLVWTFTLGDFSWSDGTPVTAHDFVYALRRIQAPETASQYSSLLYLIKNAEEVNKGELGGEELGVEALDDKTLKLTLNYPAPYLLGLLTHYTSYPVPQHVVEQYGESWIQPENIVVNGPYKLMYWRTGDQLVADLNPTGFGAAEACFQRVVYFELEDETAVENKIQAGALDINNAFSGARQDELERKFPGWPRTTPSLLTTYWAFNTRIAPFDDVRVRKALSMALDREFIVRNVLTPGYEPAYSFVPPGISNYDVARPVVEFKSLSRDERLVAAKALLIEAGYGPDNPFEFEFTHRSTDDNPKAAPVAQANWADIASWVKPVIIKQDTQVLYARLRQGDFTISDAAWVADFDDPINFLYLLDSATGQQNYGAYANAEYDALLTLSSTERDMSARAELFAQAEEIMLGEYPLTPMWFQVTKNLVDPTLTGWEENAIDQHRSRFLCREGSAE